MALGTRLQQIPIDQLFFAPQRSCLVEDINGLAPILILLKRQNRLPICSDVLSSSDSSRLYREIKKSRGIEKTEGVVAWRRRTQKVRVIGYGVYCECIYMCACVCRLIF